MHYLEKLPAIKKKSGTYFSVEMDLFDSYHWCIFRLSGVRLDNRPTYLNNTIVRILQTLLFTAFLYTIIGDIVLIILFPINFQVFCGTAFPATSFLNSILRQFYFMWNHKLFKEIAEDMVEVRLVIFRFDWNLMKLLAFEGKREFREIGGYSWCT